MSLAFVVRVAQYEPGFRCQSSQMQAWFSLSEQPNASLACVDRKAEPEQPNASLAFVVRVAKCKPGFRYQSSQMQAWLSLSEKQSQSSQMRA